MTASLRTLHLADQLLNLTSLVPRDEERAALEATFAVSRAGLSLRSPHSAIRDLDRFLAENRLPWTKRRGCFTRASMSPSPLQ